MRRLMIFCGLMVSLFLQAQTKFALLTDLHVSPGKANERALNRIVDEINASDIPFVIITGDITNQGSNAELANDKRLFARFRKPYYLIPGNHETTWSQSAVREYYRLFGSDRFFFKRDNLLFVGYNTGPYMKMGDGHVKHEDLLWLDSILTKETVKGTRLLAFAHYPLVENDMGNAGEVVSVLKKHDAIVSFCGHGHAYKEMNFEGMKGMMVRSTFLGQDTVTAGYTVVQVTPDSVFVNEKKLGETMKRRFAFSMDASRKMTEPSEPTALPQFEQPTSVSLAYQDKASVFTGVAVDKNALYFGNSLGEIKALSKARRKVLWSVSFGYSLYATPVCANGLVIVPTADGELRALSAKNGREVWTVKADGPFVADGCVVDGKLYQGGYKSFYCVDVATGKVDWKFTDINNYCQARPAIADGKILFGAWDTNLYCLNQQTGALIWKWNNGKAQDLYSPANCVPAVHDGKVIIVAPDRYMTALDLSTGKQLWRSNQYQVRESQGVSADGKTVYAKLMDGQLLAVSSESSEYKPLWTVDAGLGYEHAPCPIQEQNGVVYLGSRNGVVVAVDAASHKVLWSFKEGNSEVNQFSCDAQGNVYFSLIEGKIYKIGAKK
ncbi:MAG: PQQ-binding-like beta-propeller repeat protein [Bacteroidota bacterium]|nr:PQQ-binding-like beta-propeller repeat protein [Bacteroidota bacterium]